MKRITRTNGSCRNENAARRRTWTAVALAASLLVIVGVSDGQLRDTSQGDDVQQTNGGLAGDQFKSTDRSWLEPVDTSLDDAQDGLGSKVDDGTPLPSEEFMDIHGYPAAPMESWMHPPTPTGCSSDGGMFSNGESMVINPGNYIESTINVPGPAGLGGGGASIWDVNLVTNLAHHQTRNVTMILRSPQGTRTLIVCKRGTSRFAPDCSEDYFDGTLWDDDAGDPVSDHNFFLDCTRDNGDPVSPLVPEGALGAFIDESPFGDWTLKVIDSNAPAAPTSTNYLNGWSLEIEWLLDQPANDVISRGRQFPNPRDIYNPCDGSDGPPSAYLEFDVPEGRVICDVNMQMRVQHQRANNLEVALTSPGGTTITIVTDPGDHDDYSYDTSSAVSFGMTEWDDDEYDDHNSLDEITASIVDYSTSLWDDLIPEEAMAAFNGEDPSGVWRLDIIDDECDGYVGRFRGWRLDITTCDCPPRGACCLPNGWCIDYTTQEDCESGLVADSMLGAPGPGGYYCSGPGVWAGEDTHCYDDRDAGTPPIPYGVVCPEPGACCLPGGDCVQAECTGGLVEMHIHDEWCIGGCGVSILADCEADLGGWYAGDDTYCEEITCPPIGACCVPLTDVLCVYLDLPPEMEDPEETTCLVLPLPECLAWDGEFLGDGSSCTFTEPGRSLVATPELPIPDGPYGGPGPYRDGDGNGNGDPHPPIGVSHTMTVYDSFEIQDLDVDLIIHHTWTGDLTVLLSHGDTTVVLVERPGLPVPYPVWGYYDDGFNIILDDEGIGGPIENATADGGIVRSAPNYTPNEALSAFDGDDAQGDWTITVIDSAYADYGYLLQWSLHFNSCPACGPDCQPNGIPDACEFQSGDAEDCNGNGIPDECDIADHESYDCNWNGIPDECEPDSDSDGVPDDCDLCPDDPDKIFPGICGCGLPDVDSDQDGVPDCFDGCPNDPYKQAPGFCGCGYPDDANGDGQPDCDGGDPCCGGPCCGDPPGDPCATDSDGDGMPDCYDQCPDDPYKIAPGICGCGVTDDDWDQDGVPNCNDACPLVGDSDGDGTQDCDDLCPSDPNKTEPGICGCGVSEHDGDLDGVPDCYDGCPLDPLKVAPDHCGCGVSDDDTDGDGTADCEDQCPDDNDKTLPGICGCGNPDVDTDGDLILDCDDPCPLVGDSDGDGTQDCEDECPNDPDKTEPGICGCGVSDVDTDLDGTPDCNDDCPDDNDKTSPGICGCGNPDVDTDGDGILDCWDPCPLVGDSDGDGTQDCEDLCPSDPDKTEPGICGCYTPDDDTDGDGTVDCEDECPEDHTKTVPGLCGCGSPDVDTDGDGILDCWDPCPLVGDFDGDGTQDCEDLCPSDPDKTEPGICGCYTPDDDTDGDGTVDCEDECPEDHTKTVPGLCGCGSPDVDTDGDLVYDCDDLCPLDPNKSEPGECGCHLSDIDSDGDGTPDCNDGCPWDPDKIEEGQCGCGNPDTDTDGDGTADCNDECPLDPGKTEPGICGCGLSDIDSDLDGAPDCLDQCPWDPDKIVPGDCGCGVEDVDTDHDGVADCIDGCPDNSAKTYPGPCGCDGDLEVDLDYDGVPDCIDNCELYNPDQADCNYNHIGDVCEIDAEPAAYAVDGMANHCYDAKFMCTDVTYLGHTVGSSPDVSGGYPCGGRSGWRDVWYKYRPSMDGSAHFSILAGYQFDAVLSIHTACPTSVAHLASSAVGCNATNPYGVTVQVQAGQTYYVRVAGNGSSEGSFQMWMNGPTCARSYEDQNDNGILDECEPPPAGGCCD